MLFLYHYFCLHFDHSALIIKIDYEIVFGIFLSERSYHMKFGYFDDVNKEYVITTPKTPLPWINYLGTQDFSA